MHSFIIISNDKTRRKEYIDGFCTERKIGKFDEKFFTTEEQSLGIALVREILAAAFLTPSQSKEKVLILEDAQKLTNEAQNALLKLLEEPPSNTYIILSCTTDAYFLPTILSRCKKVVLEDGENILSEEDIIQYTSTLESLTSSSVAEKLVLAEKLAAEKEELSHWLTQYIFFLREKMIQDPTNTLYSRLLQKLQEAYQLFQTTNVTPRMILEHTFLELT